MHPKFYLFSTPVAFWVAAPEVTARDASPMLQGEICLYVHLSICLFICLSIHLSNHSPLTGPQGPHARP